MYYFPISTAVSKQSSSINIFLTSSNAHTFTPIHFIPCLCHSYWHDYCLLLPQEQLKPLHVLPYLLENPILFPPPSTLFPLWLSCDIWSPYSPLKPFKTLPINKMVTADIHSSQHHIIFHSRRAASAVLFSLILARMVLSLQLYISSKPSIISANCIPIIAKPIHWSATEQPVQVRLVSMYYKIEYLLLSIPIETNYWDYSLTGSRFENNLSWSPFSLQSTVYKLSMIWL